MIDNTIHLYKSPGAIISCTKMRGDVAYYSVRVVTNYASFSILITEKQRDEIFAALQSPING